uniref:Hypothetical chloroplast protein 29 n=1 Tax=Bangia fuscopurpurea TaxID=101920 RepID=A0A0F6VXT3_BANFU|nr:hypothetical chloroplast protein 29 [Bangia fuscopurpurea]
MSYNLMLVENDNALSHAVQEYLRDQGFIVHVASNGLDAFNLVNQYKFDLIISDIMMPIIDGYELLEKLQKNDNLSKIPVIFLTAKGMTKDRIKGYNLGCHGYLSKPFDPEELLSLINNLISRKSSFSKLCEKDSIIETPTVNLIHLTPREKSILSLVIEGLTNKEIAFNLDTSIRNVEKYVSRLLQKTRMKNRTLLVKYSINNKLLDENAKGE